MVASDAQRATFLRGDLTVSASVVLVCPPDLVEHLGPVKTATDFAFNAKAGLLPLDHGEGFRERQFPGRLLCLPCLR